ncbi:hypothetical protein CTI12_AA281340 [Artemisia annua]|uniref:Uncharacterized protein n=1 Tax=Artemisia annua TaxID=35608 RepID=A0A2U1N671_ARTAN|nr:hypothetical protein CTI12_AA281340 [Artemisia annua]
MKMKKEDIVQRLKFGGTPRKLANDVVVHAGNKVLPVNESTTTLSSSKNQNPEKGDRTKTITRMRELLKWAAAAKSDKGGKYIARKVQQFRNRTTLKTIRDDDQMTNESPKISFRWEVESCSTFSSALSVSSTNKNDQNVNIEIHPNLDGNSNTIRIRSGSWVTTDSDFVVLEL